MAKITFDAIHSKSKQSDLNKMMVMAAAECLKIPNPNTVLNACPVCKGEHIIFYAQKFGFTMDRCESCRHIFCNPMPHQTQLDAYYNSEMKAFENQFFSDTFENRIPIFDYRIDVIHQYLSEGKLLDVGSAIGIFIEALRRKETSLSIECCEPSKDAAERLQRRFPNITLHQTWLQYLDAENTYDAITLWDTLEHIVDLTSFVSTIHNLLKPGGLWFFATPNTDSFEWCVAGDDHVQLLPPGHVNLFNKKSAAVLLESFQFELVDIQTPNGTLDVSYVEKLIATTDKFDTTLGKFLKQKLTDEKFKKGFAKLVSDTTNAGNILVVARKRK